MAISTLKSLEDDFIAQLNDLKEKISSIDSCEKIVKRLVKKSITLVKITENKNPWTGANYDHVIKQLKLKNKEVLVFKLLKVPEFRKNSILESVSILKLNEGLWFTNVNMVSYKRATSCFLIISGPALTEFEEQIGINAASSLIQNE